VVVLAPSISLHKCTLSINIPFAPLQWVYVVHKLELVLLCKSNEKSVHFVSTCVRVVFWCFFFNWGVSIFVHSLPFWQYKGVFVIVLVFFFAQELGVGV
jgi:hypothetical protein